MYVYLNRSEPNRFTVGFYDPKGSFVFESEHTSSEEAANRVAALNGGIRVDHLADFSSNIIDCLAQLGEKLEELEERIKKIEEKQQ